MGKGVRPHNKGGFMTVPFASAALPAPPGIKVRSLKTGIGVKDSYYTHSDKTTTRLMGHRDSWGSDVYITYHGRTSRHTILPTGGGSTYAIITWGQMNLVTKDGRCDCPSAGKNCVHEALVAHAASVDLLPNDSMTMKLSPAAISALLRDIAGATQIDKSIQSLVAYNEYIASDDMQKFIQMLEKYVEHSHTYGDTILIYYPYMQVRRSLRAIGFVRDVLKFESLYVPDVDSDTMIHALAWNVAQALGNPGGQDTALYHLFMWQQYLRSFGLYDPEISDAIGRHGMHCATCKSPEDVYTIDGVCPRCMIRDIKQNSYIVAGISNPEEHQLLNLLEPEVVVGFQRGTPWLEHFSNWKVAPWVRYRHDANDPMVRRRIKRQMGEWNLLARGSRPLSVSPRDITCPACNHLTLNRHTCYREEDSTLYIDRITRILNRIFGQYSDMVELKWLLDVHLIGTEDSIMGFQAQVMDDKGYPEKIAIRWADGTGHRGLWFDRPVSELSDLLIANGEYVPMLDQWLKPAIDTFRKRYCGTSA